MLGSIELERCQLKNGEVDDETFERAVKHTIIAAKLGCDKAVTALKDMYKGGVIEKDEFATVLREYQAAVDATKSPQREWAAKHAQKFCPPV